MNVAQSPALTQAQYLMADERIARARALIMEAVSERQEGLSGPRPPDPDLAPGYEALLASFKECRGQPLYYPYIASGFGCGPLVELADGSVKYDMICGIGVHAFGHSHPRMIGAAFDAVLDDTLMQGNLQQSATSLKLMQALLRAANRRGAGFAHVFLSSSGAMANENALKVLFHKRSPADRLLVFENCFMGRTLALGCATDRPAYRAGLPSSLTVDYVPFYDHRRPAQSTARAVEVLESHLARHPGRHAAMGFELVQGEGGYRAGSPRFFRALSAVLRKAGVPLMVDEIQTFGRGQEIFAFQAFGLDQEAQVVTCGKMLHACATLFRKELAPAPGLLSQTFTASSASLRAGLMVLEALENGGLTGKNGRIPVLARYFCKGLAHLAKRFPQTVAGPFGFGAMIAFTLENGDGEKTKAFCRDLFDAGIIAFPAGGHPARVRFLPPFPAMEQSDVDAVLAILGKVIEARVRASKKGET